MIAICLIALFTLAALVALVTIGLEVAAALPRIAALRAALVEGSPSRELRFTIREITVAPRRGQVVRLPLRVKPLASPQPLRAAA